MGRERRREATMRSYWDRVAGCGGGGVEAGLITPGAKKAGSLGGGRYGGAGEGSWVGGTGVAEWWLVGWGGDGEREARGGVRQGWR